MPILAFHAIKDEFCPIPYVDKLIDKYCAAGANIHFQVSRSHPGLWQNDAQAWLLIVLTGWNSETRMVAT